jgi:hypothetical protein
VIVQVIGALAGEKQDVQWYKRCSGAMVQRDRYGGGDTEVLQIWRC